MNEQVEKFLEERRRAEQEEKQAQRNAFLLKNGLWEKEYRPEDAKEGSNLWPEVEFSPGEIPRFYKKIPLVLAEDDWAEIERACDVTAAGQADAPLPEKNSVASLLKGLAIVVYICALIDGIVLGGDGYGNFSFLLCLLYWVVGLFSGSLLLGFSEVIRLLHEIRQK